MIELNKQALLSYEAKDFETARNLLNAALREAKMAGMEADKMTARTYLHLGAVYWVGFRNQTVAIQNFSQAKRIRPDIQLTPSIETVDLKAVFDMATPTGPQEPRPQEPLQAQERPQVQPPPQFQARPQFQAQPQAQPPPQAQAPQPLPAAPKAGSKRLAVLEFQGKNVDEDVLMTFSDGVRGGVLEALGGRGVSVMTRENMLVLLKDMGKQECTEGDCEVETARNIGADFVVSGRVVVMEDTYVVTLKLHETKGGNLLGSVSFEAKSQVALMRSLSDQARRLVTGPTGPAAR